MLPQQLHNTTTVDSVGIAIFPVLLKALNAICVVNLDTYRKFLGQFLDKKKMLSYFPTVALNTISAAFIDCLSKTIVNVK